MSGRAIVELPVGSIACAPQVRSRFDKLALEALAASMTAHGLQQPVRVAPAAQGASLPYSMLDGERRLRAARLLKWETIPAIVETQQRTAVEVAVQSLIANCQREDLSPIELANALDRLVKEGGMTQDQAADAVAFSAPSVSRTLSLLTLPKEVRARVHDGTLPAGTAYSIARVRDPRKRMRLIEQALNGELTRDAAAEASRTRAPRAPKEPRVQFSLGESGKLVVRPDASLEELVQELGRLSGRLREVEAPGRMAAEAAEMLLRSGGDEDVRKAS